MRVRPPRPPYERATLASIWPHAPSATPCCLAVPLLSRSCPLQLAAFNKNLGAFRGASLLNARRVEAALADMDAAWALTGPFGRNAFMVRGRGRACRDGDSGVGASLLW